MNANGNCTKNPNTKNKVTTEVALLKLGKEPLQIGELTSLIEKFDSENPITNKQTKNLIYELCKENKIGIDYFKDSESLRKDFIIKPEVAKMLIFYIIMKRNSGRKGYRHFSTHYKNFILFKKYAESILDPEDKDLLEQIPAFQNFIPEFNLLREIENLSYDFLVNLLNSPPTVRLKSMYKIIKVLEKQRRKIIVNNNKIFGHKHIISELSLPDAIPTNEHPLKTIFLSDTLFEAIKTLLIQKINGQKYEDIATELLLLQTNFDKNKEAEELIALCNDQMAKLKNDEQRINVMKKIKGVLNENDPYESAILKNVSSLTEALTLKINLEKELSAEAYKNMERFIFNAYIEKPGNFIDILREFSTY